MAENYKRIAKEILKEAFVLIDAGKARYKGAAMVMAPIFTAENIGEGYIQRVKAIDTEILCDRYNVYVDFETKNPQPTLTQVDDRHLLITFNSHDKPCAKAAAALAKKCGLLYTHSVMRAMADIVGADIHRLYRIKNLVKIWDVHGSVPEEFALADNYFEAQNAQQAEELFVDNSTIIITVNLAMKSHLEKKYGKVLDNVVVLPIFGDLSPCEGDIFAQKADFKLPTAVYAGGLQPWQNIPLMQTTIKRAPDSYRYKIFVPDPEEYKNLWGVSPLPPDCEISSKTPSEVLQQYKQCHYGFVLRDDITVNNVACPTKLIEYLQYGIVPVLKTSKIGDFEALGMQYITYESFVQEPQTESQYQKMARENLLVLDRLAFAHKTGKEELQRRLL